MLSIKYQNSFKKDFKRIVKHGYDIGLLETAITILAQSGELPPSYHDHTLRGDYSGCHECHITPDRLLVYQISNDELLLILTRTGTHSDLF